MSEKNKTRQSPYSLSAEKAVLGCLLLNKEAIYKTVKKTNRVLILHEDCLTGGIGGELAALINENCFEYLDAPILRCASLDTPVPFANELEEQFLPLEELDKKINQLVNY